MDTAKLKKTLLMSIPYLFAAWAGNKISISARFTEGKGADDKLLSFMDHFGQAMSNPLPSLHPVDLLGGALIGLAFFGIMQYKRATAKKMRSGREHGSARWASADEAQMLRAKQFCDNMIITATLWMTMKKPKTVKLARNHNVCIIGGSGTGKTSSFLIYYTINMRKSLAFARLFRQTAPPDSQKSGGVPVIVSVRSG